MDSEKQDQTPEVWPEKPGGWTHNGLIAYVLDTRIEEKKLSSLRN